MSAGISVAIIARNESANLPRCLGALGFSDDVLVVDDDSADGTPDVARAAGARVLDHPLRDFADQRNWAMTAGGLRHDWVLHLDADEVVTPALAAELPHRAASAPPATLGFHLARKTMLGERWLRYSATYPVYVPRLVRRDAVRYVMRGHGETVASAPGAFGYLAEPCLHYNFSKGWADWFERHNRYSSAEAQRLVVGAPAAPLRACFTSDPAARRAALRAWSLRLPARPLLRFLYVYLGRGGWLDGRPGLTYALLQSIYEYMIGLKVREAAAAMRAASRPR